MVAAKRVVDYSIRIRVKADGTGIETNNIKLSMNPFDEIAVEAAVALKEQGKATETVVISIGPEGVQEVLRTALAMGIDRAIHVKTEQLFEPINIAKILQKIAEKEQPQIIILGKQAIDDDCNQTGQMLAALLDWPQATFASKVTVAEHLVVTREVDGGLETLQLDLPAVITTDLRLNKPRYSSLPNIMKAKSKPLETIIPDTLELHLQPHTKILNVAPPIEKTPGIKVATVQELVQKLHEEAKVI